jgi:hypothetical protein
VRLSTARTLDRIALLTATVMLAAQRYGIPTREFWKAITEDRPYLLILLLSAVGIFGVLTPFELISRRSRIERQVILQKQILTTFGQLLEVAKSIQPPVPLSDPGLHIWRKHRSIRHPRGELVRVATYRLGSSPATRALHPTRGVGVVGLCWQKDQEVKFDVEEIARQVPDENSFVRYREARGRESVMGFSWAEFQRFKHRGAVFATPIRNGRARFTGCLNFDVDHGYAQLDDRHLWHALNSLAIVLGQDGFDNV